MGVVFDVYILSPGRPQDQPVSYFRFKGQSTRYCEVSNLIISIMPLYSPPHSPFLPHSPTSPPPCSPLPPHPLALPPPHPLALSSLPTPLLSPPSPPLLFISAEVQTIQGHQGHSMSNHTNMKPHILGIELNLVQI